MRFTRTKWRYEERELSRRRRAAILLSQKRQRDRLPLFAELVGEGQKSVEETAKDQDHAEAEWVEDARNRRARWWKSTRAELYALSDNERALVLAYWNEHHWLPGTPEHLASLIHSFKVGDITPEKMSSDLVMMRATRERLGPREPRPEQPK